MRSLLLFLFCLSASVLVCADSGELPSAELCLPEELTIDLKNPTFSQGVISTDEGGVVSAPGIRIQARTICYTNKVENGIKVQKLFAEGDLLMEYAGRAFVGSKLDFDFVTKTGVLWDGKTFIDIWFLGGEKIQLREDGTFYITSAFITTCEGQDNTWEINAKNIEISQDSQLAAKNISLRFLKVPFFWLPSFKSNLKMFSEPPIKYKVIYDKGIGPRATIRYRVFSWKDLNTFFRLDYRLKKGFGGAFESEYISPDKNTTFVTRSYGAKDKSFPDEKGAHRYRLQGLYHTQNKQDTTQLHLTWDKLSDTRMVGDFRSDDFEINTQRRTQLSLKHQIESAFFNVRVQPRVNRFDSIDQELPAFSAGARPFELGHSGIIANNYVRAGYLNYVYANDLRKEFHALGLKSSTRSVRLQTSNELYRPFGIGHFTLTPRLGVTGIFYHNSPERHPVGQGILTYGFTGTTRLFSQGTKLRHVMEPYLEFRGLSSPTTPLSHHFYFDLDDGYNVLNQVRLGWKNTLFTRKRAAAPLISSDLYTYAYLGQRKFRTSCPKTYLSLECSRPSYLVKGGVSWNNEQGLFDFANIRTDVTVSEDIAFGLEMRHRSKYDWRKADHDNFILDVSRSIPELLTSPISDGRNTLLGKLFIRLAPKWDCNIQYKRGWGRRDEPLYNAGKIDLITLLTCAWKLRLSYERMPNDNRFTAGFDLVK